MTDAEKAARDALAKAKPNEQSDHPNWSDGYVVELLEPLLAEHTNLRAALIEALDAWQGWNDVRTPLYSCEAARIAELRKLTTR